jgi:hypothetical protein
MLVVFISMHAETETLSLPLVDLIISKLVYPTSYYYKRATKEYEKNIQKGNFLLKLLA